MKFSVYPNFEADRTQHRKTLLALLTAPRFELNALGDVSIPQVAIYVDDKPRQVNYGYWELNEVAIYLPCTSGSVSPLKRLSILTVMAVAVGVEEDESISAAIGAAFETVIAKESIESTTFVLSKHEVSQVAFSPMMTQFAARINNKWYTATGVEVVPTPSWTILDF